MRGPMLCPYPVPLVSGDDQQVLAVIAVARQQLPRESLLQVCSASATVRHDLELADWSGVCVSDTPADVVPVRAGHSGWHR